LVFNQHIDKTNRVLYGMKTPCWIWVGKAYRYFHFYGHISLRRFHQPSHPLHYEKAAHRIAWIFAYGFIPPKLYVIHYCNKSLCVRPDHLFTGTMAELVSNRDRKGRQSQGNKHYKSKLTSTQVQTIRRLYSQGKATRRMLAIRYGVSKESVYEIVAGKTWKGLLRKTQ